MFDGEVLDAACKLYFEDINNPEIIILGCTHFPLIKDRINAYYPKATLIHSGDAIVERLKAKYQLKTRDQKPSIQFFATENVDQLKRVAQSWL